MGDNLKGMVLTSFAADALALGVHWIYSQTRIQREFGKVVSYIDPGPDSYHPSKRKGEFTHYGDQALVLLESVASCRTFDPADFSARWRALFEDYDGYRDQATNTTLENLERGVPFMEAGSPSNDLSGAARIAPLVFALHKDEDSLVRAARIQTMLTHADSLAVDAAEFLARTTLAVLRGQRPSAAMDFVARDVFGGTELEGLVTKGMDMSSDDVLHAVKALGQDCHTPHALPAVVRIVCALEHDLKEALVTNVMAGGDSAGRGMAVGMLLGAFHGAKALPRAWIDEMASARRIETLLDEIESFVS